MARGARRGLVALAWLFLCGRGQAPLFAGDGTFTLQGVAEGRGLWVQGQQTWLRNGFGRLTEGANSSADDDFTARGQLHLGIDWRPGVSWLVHVHGVAQGEPASYGGRKGGLVEGFVQFRSEPSAAVSLRFRAGTFFPQTSLENVDPLWQSPYTLTLSALNTWTAEELRLTGLESAVTLKSGKDDRFDLAGTAFAVDDAAGALIAWRGWSLGDRLSTVGEILPLPPLRSLAPGGAFADQRDGTGPIDELDGRLGWQVRGRWSRADAFEARFAYLDNNGDRRLHAGQYSWATSFVTGGLRLRLGSKGALLAEGASGSTGMGPAIPGGPRVDVAFTVGYALASWGGERWRFSGRVDGFRNRDRDGTAEPNQESGWAWTAAVLWRPIRALRVGAEYLVVRAQRPAAADSGYDPDTNARRAQLEVRTSF